MSLPTQCPCCRSYTFHRSGVCPPCLVNLPWSETSPSWHATRPKPLAVYAAMVFAPPIAPWIAHAKDHGDYRRVDQLASLLVLAMGGWSLPQPDAIIPVPAHWCRRLRRGFNQADRLARTLGHASGVPVQYTTCVRHRPTPPQRGRTATQRHRNVQAAFSVRGPLPPSVWIVDDVVTTGATLSAVAQCLRRHGVHTVVGLALATTLPS